MVPQGQRRDPQSHVSSNDQMLLCILKETRQNHSLAFIHCWEGTRTEIKRGDQTCHVSFDMPLWNESLHAIDKNSCESS